MTPPNQTLDRMTRSGNLESYIQTGRLEMGL
jgi:hypothetical protein